MKCLKAILNQTKRERIKNADIRLKLRLDGIRNYIQKRRLTWFAHVMGLATESISEKYYIYTKKEGK